MKYYSLILILLLAPFVFLAWVPTAPIAPPIAPPIASAATLFFAAPTTTVSIGEDFSVAVLVDSGDRGFNAAEASIVFPNDVLEVTSVDATPSSTVFNFWLSKPSFSNEEGTVSFSGGTTRGVVGPAIQVLSLHVRAKGSGEALITTSDASINASDGSGTNILDSIKALRITVSGAAVSIPAKPTPTPAPAPEPPKVVVGKKATTTAGAQAPAESGGCTGLFAGCDLRFPVIGSVTTLLHEQVGADLLVSGTAPEGAHVHLLLLRDDVPYKEITAIVQPDRTWEGSLSNVYSYGTYILRTWAEDDRSSRKSEVVTWTPIDIYPPFTLDVFGHIVRWYAGLTAVFGVLAGLLGAFLAWRYFMRHEPYSMGFATIAFGVAALAFVGMFILAYVLWQKEYRSLDTFWKATGIPCILREPSYLDVFSSVQLSIYTDGKAQPIPADVGLSPTCVAQVHTHDTTGRIHLQRTSRPVTLADFFAVAGIPVQQDGYALSVTVNGKNHTGGVGSFSLQNGDAIVVTYTSTSPAKGR